MRGLGREDLGGGASGVGRTAQVSSTSLDANDIERRKHSRDRGRRCSRGYRRTDKGRAASTTSAAASFKTPFQPRIGQMAIADENTQATDIQKRDVDIAVGPAGARIRRVKSVTSCSR